MRSARRRRTWAATASLLAIACALPAIAQSAPLDLSWTAPPDCPSGAEVQAEVLRIVGRTAGPRKQVVARARVERTARGAYRVTLETRADDSPGHRAFEAESCRAAADAAALILAITVNPEVSAPEPLPLPPPPPTTTTATATATTTANANANANANATPTATANANATPTPTTTATATPTATIPPRSPFSRAFAIGASFAVDTGSLPSAAVGAELSLAWIPGDARIEIAGSYWAPQTATAPNAALEGADFQLLAVGARGGYAWRFGAFAIGPRGGAEIARLSASGFGGAAAFHQSAVWGNALVGALGTWSPHPRVSVRLGLDGAIPLSRPTFVVTEPAPEPALSVHRPAALAGRAFLGAEFRFF